MANEIQLAGKQGFEPRSRGPEPRVLPLDDFPTRGDAFSIAAAQGLCQSHGKMKQAQIDTER